MAHTSLASASYFSTAPASAFLLARGEADALHIAFEFTNAPRLLQEKQNQYHEMLSSDEICGGKGVFFFPQREDLPPLPLFLHHRVSTTQLMSRANHFVPERGDITSRDFLMYILERPSEKINIYSPLQQQSYV